MKELQTTPNGIRINAQKDTLYFAVTNDGGVFMMKTTVIGGEEYRFSLKSSY